MGDARVQTRNERRATEGSAGGDGKVVKVSLPSFLLPITPRAPLNRASLFN